MKITIKPLKLWYDGSRRNSTQKIINFANTKATVKKMQFNLRVTKVLQASCKAKTFSITSVIKEAKKAEEPQTGDPKKTGPLESDKTTRLTEDGNSEKHWSPEGQKTSHLGEGQKHYHVAGEHRGRTPKQYENQLRLRHPNTIVG